MLIKKRPALRPRSRRWRFARARSRQTLIAAAIVLCTAVVSLGTFFQSFETGTEGWFNAKRVPTSTHLITSDTLPFHAEDGGGAFTRWGGYSKTFPIGGYTTSVDIYLDITAPYGSATSTTAFPNDTRFDWTSAISTPACGHRRDFAFNAGFYTDTDATGSGPRFVISASNNTGRSGANPKNAGRSPYTITAEGWYTFEHRFRDQGGVLAVDLTIKNDAGVPLMTWTLSDPSDLIGVTVGGNRYGWFPTDEFPYLAFDTSALIGFQDYCVPPASTPGAKVTGGGSIPGVDDKNTFGLTAKVNNAGDPSGNVTYQDHGLGGRTVKSTAVTSVTITGSCANINGTATVDGNGSFGFQVRVCDNGEAGSSDTFSIAMSDGYTASGTLSGGNIQIH
jgi:hypothetical protein